VLDLVSPARRQVGCSLDQIQSGMSSPKAGHSGRCA